MRIRHIAMEGDGSAALTFAIFRALTWPGMSRE